MLEAWIGFCSKIRKCVELLAYVVGTWLDQKLDEREGRGGEGDSITRLTQVRVPWDQAGLEPALECGCCALSKRDAVWQCTDY